MYYPERSLIALFRQAMPVYIKHLRLLGIITLIAFLPMLILNIFIPNDYATAFIYVIENFQAFSAEQISIEDLTTALNTAVVSGFQMFVFLVIGIELLFMPIATAGATLIVRNSLTSTDSNFDNTASAALSGFLKAAVTTILALIAPIFVLMMIPNAAMLMGFLIIFAVYMVTLIVFYQNIVADTGRWGFVATHVSRQMARGRFFRVFLKAAAIFIAYFIHFWLLEAFAQITGINTAHIAIRLIYSLAARFMLMFYFIVFACWYFDIKIRNKELFASISPNKNNDK